MADCTVVDVWIGRFGSEAAFDAFFQEKYGDDDAPISPFAASQNERFYDHDWVERSFEKLGSDLLNRIGRHSYGATFGKAAEKVYARRRRPPFDGLVLVWNREIDEPRSVSKDSAKLTYLGRFDCIPD